MNFIGHKHYKNVSAFTLLELLVVMTIIVIIMAVGAPVFLTLGRSMALDTETRNIAAQLSLARQWAITHKEAVTFEWTTTNYSISGTNTGNIMTTNLIPEVKFENSGTITFNVKGECSGVGVEEIKISENRETNPKRKRIVVYKLTGGYKIEDM